MCRWADRLTCSRIEVSERRAGQRTSGQTRCRSHSEDSLPHRLAPFVDATHIVNATGAPSVFQHGWSTRAAEAIRRFRLQEENELESFRQPDVFKL
jgi:hypothetical protein